MCRQPKGRDLSRSDPLQETNSLCNGLSAEAERDKSRPYAVQTNNDIRRNHISHNGPNTHEAERDKSHPYG